MKKIVVTCLVCFLLIGQVFFMSAATHDIASGLPRSDVELAIELETFSNLDVNVVNYTERSSVELGGQLRGIASQVESLHLMAVEEIASINSSVELNPEGLPITLELLVIGDEITYLYTITEGESAIVYLFEPNIQSISEAELNAKAIDPFVSHEKNDMNYCIHEQSGTGARYGFGIMGVPGLCNGPCARHTPDPIPSGIGIRLPMQRSGNRLNFSVLTSGASTRPPRNRTGTEIGASYLYGGFISTMGNQTIISDMGIMHQRLEGTNQFAWRPYFSVSHGSSQHLPPTTIQGQVWGRNGFVLGSTINIEVRIDHPSATVSRVRLEASGTAYHQTAQGTGARTFLTHIAFRDFNRINTPTNWRVLATSAIPSNMADSNIVTAFVSGHFNNIRVDGALPVFLHTDRDFGFAVNNGNGNWFLQTCKGLGIYF